MSPPPLPQFRPSINLMEMHMNNALATQETKAPAGFTVMGVRSKSSSQGAEFAFELITSRQNTSPKRLVDPGPDSHQLDVILTTAAAAPDHGLLRPWRLVMVPTHRRIDLAEAFALALIDRDPCANLVQIEDAREKAHRAPCLMLAVARLGSCEPPIPELERMICMGAAVQNILLSAHCFGLGSSLTSGQAMGSQRMRTLFNLSADEEAVCFINIGTVSKPKTPRRRPLMDNFLSSL